MPKAKQVLKMLQRREVGAAAVHPAGEANLRENFHVLSAIFLSVEYDICRLQTWRFIWYAHFRYRGNRRYLSDIFRAN